VRLLHRDKKEIKNQSEMKNEINKIGNRFDSMTSRLEEAEE